MSSPQRFPLLTASLFQTLNSYHRLPYGDHQQYFSYICLMKILLDANVLYPPTLRDLILFMSKDGLIQPYWSAKIIEEWTISVSRQLSTTQRKSLKEVQEEMFTTFPYGLIQDYEYLIDIIHLNDVDDRHVSAAAIHGKVDLLLTFNTKDFPKSGLRKHGITPVHPDRFLCDIIPMQRIKVINALDAMAVSQRYVGATRDSLITALRNRGLIKSMRMLSAI
jgi:predicted nucleic acid-binding protein